MVKATSPIRLQSDLMNAARITGKRFHRSASEQVEYWADIGRVVSNLINPDTLLSITAGLVQVKVEPVISPVVDPDDVFSQLEIQRRTGVLRYAVSENPIKYQASLTHPGQLERIDSEGGIVVGQFFDGEFRTAEDQ